MTQTTDTRFDSATRLDGVAALGHGLARLFGAGPEADRDDDLARMSAFIERGGARPGGGSRLFHCAAPLCRADAASGAL